MSPYGAMLGGACAMVLGATVAAQAAEPWQAHDRAVARGQDLAQARCSACHAVGSDGASPNRRAPTFRSMSGRFVPYTLLLKLTEIAETGHYDMPEVPVHSDEVEGLAAYINNLGAPPSKAPPQPPSAGLSAAHSHRGRAAGHPS